MAKNTTVELMFEEGDKVVHPQQGAGRLTTIQRMEVAGIERHYYCIELINGEGELMLPVKQAEEAGLRPALGDTEKVKEVLGGDPEELSSNYRSREAHINRMVDSGEIELLIQAVRDLAWHGHQNRLTNTDARLKSEAQKLVASELAICMGITYETAQRKLSEMVSRAISQHDEEQPVN